MRKGLALIAYHLLNTSWYIVGEPYYITLLNEKSGITEILKSKEAWNYYDRFKLLAERTTPLYSEIYEDLRKYNRVLRYISQEQRFNLCKVIGSLYEIVRLTGADEGKKSDCIKLLELTDSSTGLLSKASASEMDAAVSKVLSGSFLNASDRYDLLRKAVQWDIGYAAGGSGEKLQYLASISGAYGKALLTDVLNRIDYQQGKLKAIGKGGKEICTADYTEYIEKTLFGRLLFASDTKAYASYFLDKLRIILADIENAVAAADLDTMYITDKNAERLKAVLNQICLCGVPLQSGTLNKIEQLTLYYNEGKPTLEELKRRFKKAIRDVTVDLNSLMRDNVSLFADHYWNLMWFMGQVKTGGPFDIKNTHEKFKGLDFCIYEGEIYGGDAPGNISFGYLGTAAGLGKDVLLSGGGIAQLASNTILRGNREDWDYSGFSRLLTDYGDNEGDQDYIRLGIDLYWRDWHNNVKGMTPEEQAQVYSQIGY